MPGRCQQGAIGSASFADLCNTRRTWYRAGGTGLTILLPVASISLAPMSNPGRWVPKKVRAEAEAVKAGKKNSRQRRQHERRTEGCEPADPARHRRLRPSFVMSHLFATVHSRQTEELVVDIVIGAAAFVTFDTMSTSSLTNGISGLASVSTNSAFSAAARSMGELGVASLIGAGFVQQGHLEPTTISALSKATFSILLPMFLCTSIIRTIATYGISKSSFVAPLLGIIQPYVLLQLSRLLLPMFGVDTDTDDGRCLGVCSAWGNTSVVPLIFVESLFRSAKIDALAKSYAQISLFLLGWSPFFWSYGRSALLGNKRNTDDEEIESKKIILGQLKSVASPPVIGVLIGMLVAVTPLCKLFVPNGSSERKPLLSPVYSTLVNFGRAAPPTSLLVMTSSLAIGAGIGQEKRSEKGKESGVGFFVQWLFVSTMRFLLSPMVMLGLLRLAEKYALVESSSTNPMLWFVMVLQACMPPAQNLVLMLNVADKPEKAGQMAKFLFAIYATSMAPIIVILTMALSRFGLVQP